MVLTRIVPIALVILAAARPWAAPDGSWPAASPQAATIRGRVILARPLVSSRPTLRAADGPASYAGEAYRQAVVYLESPPERLQQPASGRARMDQKNERFVPHLLTILAGTTVEFPNGDPFFHNVFSLSKPKRFDLGRYPTGRSKSVRFDRPGIVRVFCEIHSHMNAFILVFDHRFFATTDDDGWFRIERVPPGSYQLTAWYEGALRETRTVAVPAGGTAEADFVLR